MIAFEGQTDLETVSGLDHAWHKLGATSKTIEALKAAGCTNVVMAGPMRRPALSQLSLDTRSSMLLARAGSKVFGDDGLLSVIVGELEGEGFEVVGIEDILGGFLALEGSLAGGANPGPDEERDIARGIAALNAVGSADIGQAVAVQEGLVLAVEAVEGTDSMIARAGTLKRPVRGPILVKDLPQQEGRADRPTIGATTVVSCAAAGFAGIVVEAGETLIVERDETVRAAESAGIFILSRDFGRSSHGR